MKRFINSYLKFVSAFIGSGTSDYADIKVILEGDKLPKIHRQVCLDKQNKQYLQFKNKEGKSILYRRKDIVMIEEL